MKAKKFNYLFLILLFASNVEAFSQTVQFRYDLSGNSTERLIIVSKMNDITHDSTKTVFEHNDIEEKHAIRVYPNPSHDYLIISCPEFSDLHAIRFALFSNNGEQLFKDCINVGELSLNLAKYCAGTYYLKIQYGNSTNTWKIVKY